MELLTLARNILEHLAVSAELGQLDMAAFGADGFGASEAAFRSCLLMLLEKGYITGVTPIKVHGSRQEGLKLGYPRITLDGLEYLAQGKQG